MNPQVNEAYQDAKGCLYTWCPSHDGWHAFGTADTFYEGSPAVAWPLTLVVETTGKVVVDQLTYPEEYRG